MILAGASLINISFNVYRSGAGEPGASAISDLNLNLRGRDSHDEI